MASTDTLILLSKAFDSFFKKARNRGRILANNRRMARRNEKVMIPAAREMLNYITEEVQKGLPKLKSGKANAIKRMVDWKHIEEQAALIIKPAMLAVLAEGGKSIVERHIMKQERFDPIGVAAVDWSSNHSANLVTEITKKQRTAIRGFTVNGLNAGKSIPAIMRELRPTVGILEKYTKTIATARAKMIADGVPAATIATRTDRMARHYHHLRINTIARTEASFAQSEGILQGFSQMGINHVEGVSDPDACQDCKDEIDGKVYSLAESKGKIPLHPDCLPGDSLISPRGRITSVSKRWYDGKIIIIETASKRKLTCTPNHPILSDRGFCPANVLYIGGYVISDGLGQRESFSHWKNINKPTSIQEIAESFLKNRKMMTCEVPVTTPDFHNDGRGSKIAIISTNRFLMNGFNTSFRQHFLNLQFKWRKVRRLFFDCLSMLTFSIPRNFYSGNSFMRGLDLMITLRLRHLFPKIFNGFALSTETNISGLQPPANNAPGNMIFASKAFLRQSRDIQGNNFFSRKIKIAEPSKPIPGSFFDKIIHIETSLYHGYIYNLETTKSYFIVNGIASHNCECTWVAAAGEKPKPYEFVASGRNEAKIASLDNTLKGLPRRHVSGVEKYHIDTTAKIEKNVPAFKGRDIAGYWDSTDKSIHYNALHMDKRVIFHEVGHSVYETSVPYNQKSLWTAWHKKASTTLEMQYPSAYSLTNVDEFFAECYSYYHMKKYNQIDKVVKKWFDKSLKGGG